MSTAYHSGQNGCTDHRPTSANSNLIEINNRPGLQLIVQDQPEPLLLQEREGKEKLAPSI